jgi:flavodoxin
MKKALIVYDSLYGNTERIARAVAVVIPGEVKRMRVSEFDPADLEGVTLLIVGSPTHGGRPTPAIAKFIDNLQDAAAPRGMNSAAFDTRLAKGWVGLFGYAAKRMEDRLRSRGLTVVASEGFFVEGNEGPLREGEQERAAAWATEMSAEM